MICTNNKTFNFSGIPAQEPLEKNISLRAKLLLRVGFRNVSQAKNGLYTSVLCAVVGTLGAVLIKNQHIQGGCAAGAILSTGLAIADAIDLNDAISDLHRRIHSFNIS